MIKIDTVKLILHIESVKNYFLKNENDTIVNLAVKIEVEKVLNEILIKIEKGELS